MATTRASGRDRSEQTGGPVADGVGVLIVDGEQALAQALAECLRGEPGVAHARAADSCGAAAEILDAHGIDVVVVATDGEGWDPFAMFGEVFRRSADLPIVAMSGDDDPAQVTAAVVAGAVSWVPKQVAVAEFAAVVVGAAHGEASLPRRMLRQVLRRLVDGLGRSAPDCALDRLTTRERQILEYTAQGLNRREIAARLRVSVNTVRTHSQNILSKLGVHTTLEAVALVLRETAIGPKYPRPPA
jgi:DNA-binding NarL/FixJ family response regulator